MSTRLLAVRVDPLRARVHPGSWLLCRRVVCSLSSGSMLQRPAKGAIRLCLQLIKPYIINVY